MSLRLFVAHRTADRTRLRLAERAPAQGRAKHQAELLRLAERLRQDLSQDLPEDDRLLRIEPRPTTGSLIIEHSAVERLDLASLLAGAGCRLVDAPEDPAVPGLSPLWSGLRQVDQGVRRTSSGSADLRTLLFLLLLGLAVAQLLRGQVLAPAASLLWYAFDLALRGAEFEGD